LADGGVKEFEMNRLIIVGNGFDLAHGLKTSYVDFIFWYLNTKIISVLETGINHSDSIMDIQMNEYRSHYSGSIKYVSNINDLFNDENLFWCASQGVVFTHSSKDKIETTLPVKIIIKSQFFANMVNKEGNWTDIEKNYFVALLATKSTKSYLKSKYKILNREFECLKQELLKYIQIIDKEFSESIENVDLHKLAKGSFFYHLLEWGPNDSRLSQEVDTSKTQFLIVNFNYTNVIRQYRNKLKDPIEHFALPIINIHGNCLNNEIIFGYGDESHSQYQELEDQDDNELLKNMKSFYYGFSDGYSKLMAFVNGDDFVVDIIGHSLGLSDRLLFREIFERENCKFIKLFHRGNKTSYFFKRIALSRHFKDNTNMRNKVMVYSEKDAF
jgi:hypothetical protein